MLYFSYLMKMRFTMQKPTMIVAYSRIALATLLTNYFAADINYLDIITQMSL